EHDSDSCIQQRERGNFPRRTFAPTLAGQDHSEFALANIARLDQSPIAQRPQNEITEPVIVVITVRVGFDDRVGRDVTVQLLERGYLLQFFTVELLLEEWRVFCQIKAAAAQLDRVDETVRIEKGVHVGGFPDGHSSMLSGGPFLLWNLSLWSRVASCWRM